MKQQKGQGLPKKDFTSFDVSIAVQELKDTVANSRVNNIYQLNDKTLQLKLHKTGKPQLLLNIEAGKRLHLTAYALEKPQSPPAFCMALRKYLRNAWLLTVDQQEFERIAIVTFNTKRGKMSLVSEIFGEGNIILTGVNGKILQALHYKRMRDRNIIRGELYKFPPTSGINPLKITLEEFVKKLEETANVESVKALARSLGLGGVYAEEILLRAGVEKSKLCASLTEEEIKAIFESLQNLVAKVSTFTIEPQIVLDEKGEFLDAVPFKLKRYETCKIQPYSSFNEALDEFYLRVTANEKAVEATSGTNKLQREVNKIKRVVAEQEQALKEDEEKAEEDRQIGDYIYAHSTEIQFLLDKFNKAKLEGTNWDKMISETQTAKANCKTAEALFKSFDKRNLAIYLCGENLCFSVDLRMTIFENAAKFYERGKKAKQKAAGAVAALEESRRKLKEFEDRIEEAEAEKLTKPAEMMEDLVKRKVESKEWFEKFRSFVSSEDFLVVAGKDAVSNEVLVKKHAEKDEPVFHADIAGAPFVVVKSGDKVVGEQTLREAGEFAAAFSRAWREGMGAVDVYWVTPDQLSKTGPSGEYVPHGAFAVIGKRNWMRSVPLKVAVGVIDENGQRRFINGPVEAVKAKAKVYVVVIPGDFMGKEILKRTLHSLAVKLPKLQREKVAKASVERIRDFIPYTKGSIIEES
jgi:predicted ribosome quality control (RQC) complex YloA/Tae2 family protein